MAQPNETQIRDLIVKACTYLDNIRDDAGSSAVVDLEALLGAAGAYSTGPLIRSYRAAETNRARLASAVSNSTADSILRPLFETYFEIQGFQQGAFARSFELLREDFNARSQSVQGREITFGSPAANGSNVGDGVLYRCTVDRFGEPLEACFLETKTFLCTSDQHGAGGGQRHQERFLVYGAPQSQDQIARAGSGVNATMTAISARNSLLGNSSFDSFQGTEAVPTSITNWVLNTISNTQLDGTNYFRTAGGNTAPTPYGLRLDGAVTISQKFSVRNIQLDPLRPTWLSLRYNRSVGSGTGSLTLRLGSQSVAVADLSAASAGWQLLQIPLDANCYLENFNEDEIDVHIELAGSPTGYTVIDDCLLQQLQRVDGTFWAIVGGATPFQVEDEFTAADSATDTSLVARWIWRAWNEYLPSDPTTPSWSAS